MKIKIISYLTFAILSIFLIACEEETTHPTFPENNNFSEDLPNMSANEQGFNVDELNSGLEAANNIDNLDGLIIVRNGYIISEKYFNSYKQDSIHRVYSITKNVISALIGVAIDEGYISGVDELIYQYFEPLGYSLSEEKKAITIKHLLTMTSGLEWNEHSEDDYNALVNADDKIEFMLNRTLIANPGEVWNYNTPACHLLSVILTETTGMSTLEYADQKLFTPLGITQREWYKVGDYYYGGSYLNLRPMDLAKIGALYLNMGKSNDIEIIKENWIQETFEITDAQYLGFSWGNISEGNYGYLWWRDTGRIHGSIYALGYGGQYIYCVPSLQLVVVTTASFNDNTDIWGQEDEIMGLIVNYIIPSLIKDAE